MLDDAGVKVDLAPETALPDGEAYVEAGLGHADVAAMFYTSGTTGHPKGVPTTHEAFLTNSENMIRCLGIPADVGPELRTLISVPLFHVTGCNSQLLVAAQVGGASVIMPALDQAALIAALAAERITFMVTSRRSTRCSCGAGALAEADVSGVRWVGYGGAPIAPALVRSLQEAFPSGRVFNGYGMTETASLMTALPHDDAVEHADSVGYCGPVGWPWTRSATTALGELVVRGANVTSGYWQRRRRPPRRSSTGGCTPATWCASTRRAGCTSSTGPRTSSSGAARTSPASRSRPPWPARPASPRPRCWRCRTRSWARRSVQSSTAAGTVDVDKVLAHCRERLADFKVPQYISVGTPLPRNAGGKLVKARLRESVEWGHRFDERPRPAVTPMRSPTWAEAASMPSSPRRCCAPRA